MMDGLLSSYSSAPARHRKSPVGATSWRRDVPTYGLLSGFLLFPGMCLATTVQAINLIGNGLRDTLDPQLARRMCTISELALSTPWLGIRILKAAVRRQASHPSA